MKVRPLIAKLQKKIGKVPREARARCAGLPHGGAGREESRRRGRNDTYTFTKWLGEQLIMEELADST